MMEKDFRMRTFKDGISVIGESFPGFWGVRWRGCGAAFMGLRVSFCSGWGCCASIAFMGLFIAFYRGLGWAPVAVLLVGLGVCQMGWAWLICAWAGCIFFAWWGEGYPA